VIETGLQALERPRKPARADYKVFVNIIFTVSNFHDPAVAHVLPWTSARLTAGAGRAA
jgi:hypothetical protein